MPTYTPKAGDTTRSWYVIDATDVVLGRLAVAAATLLRGKHKPTFTPNVDGGDFVIVINADKIAVSGDKLTNKMAYRHSGFPGGLRSRTLGDELQKHADRVVEKAIVGMLPHNVERHECKPGESERMGAGWRQDDWRRRKAGMSSPISSVGVCRTLARGSACCIRR